ncbi:hypothetical protein JOD54_001611 [Actinokineospora baliensis]|nr:hypothetical protein [Actinokineospora baliensis]
MPPRLPRLRPLNPATGHSEAAGANCSMGRTCFAWGGGSRSVLRGQGHALRPQLCGPATTGAGAPRKTSPPHRAHPTHHGPRRNAAGEPKDQLTQDPPNTQPTEATQAIGSTNFPLWTTSPVVDKRTNKRHMRQRAGGDRSRTGRASRRAACRRGGGALGCYRAGHGVCARDRRRGVPRPAGGTRRRVGAGAGVVIPGRGVDWAAGPLSLFRDAVRGRPEAPAVLGWLPVRWATHSGGSTASTGGQAGCGWPGARAGGRWSRSNHGWWSK